ncbi:hypothetical protein B296_00048355, partial [Ensete ventricosum]
MRSSTRRLDRLHYQVGRLARVGAACERRWPPARGGHRLKQVLPRVRTTAFATQRWCRRKEEGIRAFLRQN